MPLCGEGGGHGYAFTCSSPGLGCDACLLGEGGSWFSCYMQSIICVVVEMGGLGFAVFSSYNASVLVERCFGFADTCSPLALCSNTCIVIEVLVLLLLVHLAETAI